MMFFLKVRLRQAFRLLRMAGWGILLILVLVTAGIWAPALSHLGGMSPVFACGLGWLLVGIVHLGRSDAPFIRQMELPAGQVFLLDTGLMLLPGSMLFLGLGNWPAALAFLSGIVVLALPAGCLAGRWQKKARFSLPFIPCDLFELRAAVRRYPLGWALAGLLQLGATHHIAFFLGAVAAGLLLLGTVFEFLEPKELLPDSRRALLSKWRRNALALHLFYLPAYGLAALGQSGHGWLILYAAAALETLLALLFFYKYSIWRPGSERISGGVFTAIGLLLVFLPGGILAAIPMAVWVGWKGLRRQQYFVYD